MNNKTVLDIAEQFASYIMKDKSASPELKARAFEILRWAKELRELKEEKALDFSKHERASKLQGPEYQ